MSATPQPTRYIRQAEVVWRLGPDRVLVRRPWPKHDQEAAADLLGLTALVWIALDEQGTLAEIEQRVTDAELDEIPSTEALADALDQLRLAGWVLTVGC